MSKIKKNHQPKTNKKKPAYRLRNWSQYNQALVERGSLTVWFDEHVLDQWYYQGPQQRGATSPGGAPLETKWHVTIAWQWTI